MSIGFTMKEIRENYLNKVKRVIIKIGSKALSNGCLLYTSDAADE